MISDKNGGPALVGWDQRSAGPPSIGWIVQKNGGPALEASLSHPTKLVDQKMMPFVIQNDEVHTGPIQQ